MLGSDKVKQHGNHNDSKFHGPKTTGHINQTSHGLPLKFAGLAVVFFLLAVASLIVDDIKLKMAATVSALVSLLAYAIMLRKIKNKEN